MGDIYGEFSIPGCTDKSAINFDKNATSNDGSCKYPIEEKPEKPQKPPKPPKQPKPQIIQNDCSDIKKQYQNLIIILIISFTLFIIVILLKKNKNISKDVGKLKEDPFVIYLN